MLLPAFILLFCLFILCNARVLLYDTEYHMLSPEKFDCIYILDNINSDYGGSSAGKVPYCRRPNSITTLTRAYNKCENKGEIKYFDNLLKENVQPSEVFKWSSSVEMTDKYAAFYHNNFSIFKSNENQDFLCHCTYPSTFGRYCEYTLTHEANSFEASQTSQASFRLHSFDYHQQYGHIVCYKTLSCNSGLLCLDWRDICDGEQQCDDGRDEENRDKLEFNECDEDEYRCTNGMCIPEEYWLDGDMDCMDWSDESQMTDIYAKWCFWEKTTIDCDEHLCHHDMWSCGDGQCILWLYRLVFQNFLRQTRGCWNMRNMNYMCELTSLARGWTRPNGLCWFFTNRYNDTRLNMNNVALSNEEKCIYLIRCSLSNGSELHCPCNSLNCSYIMPNVCETNLTYRYPEGTLIRPYLKTSYDWTRDFKNKIPHLIVLDGNVRCRGYQGYFNYLQQHLFITISLGLILDRWWDSVICAKLGIIRNSNSSMKYDDDCWKDSLTFNGHPYAVVPDICTLSRQCISQYRINDRTGDCLDDEDENVFISNKDLCSRVRKHRFQCSAEQPTCSIAYYLGDRNIQCSNNYDKYLYGSGHDISELKCQKSDLAACQLLKEYIKNSSFVSNLSIDSYLNTHQLQYQSISQIAFRSYCDSFWSLPEHIDEVPENCQNWICHEDQYQCQTGQCISLDWVCDGQWDCADASDEEAMLVVHHWSRHNQQLEGLNEKRAKCLQDYSNLPFSKFCDTTKEFPCLRSNVSDPLNVEKNRPCILYSKIGDGIEDCYNAYDEKNTFEYRGEMWGFRFQCGNFSTYHVAACHPAFDKCAQIFCPYQHYQLSNCNKSTDAVCLNNSHCVPDGRCNHKGDCSHGEDEYWCAPDNVNEQLNYRYRKQKLQDNHTIFDRQTYPPFQPATEAFSVLSQPLLSSSIRTTRNLQNSLITYSFICNKGVTAIYFDGRVSCFCPPSYFGYQCESFSDRITIITHLNLTTCPSLSNTNLMIFMMMPTLFKIKVNFLFNEKIIDHYEFYSNPTVEIHNYIKHKFYLLYSRSNEMLSHKKTRFFNRTDIERKHPYSVHFDLYGLYNNLSTPITLGSWHYPIYFDFLPSFRLAKILRFPNWFGNSNLDLCINHTCNENSTCQPIFNHNSYYCSCKSGFYGKDCSRYEESCNSYCSPNSFCRPDDRSLISDTKNPFCICPFGYFGPRCYLKFSQCDTHPCSNNGTCIYTYESYAGDSFKCICSKFFYGDRCQNESMAIKIQLNTSSITDESPRASTIQFYDVDLETFKLFLRHQQVMKGFPSSIYYAHGLEIAPALGVVKAYYDSNQPKHFLIYIQPNISIINISSTPENCPHVSLLLDFDDISVFNYHHICRNDSERLCFYDNDYLCICQWNNYRIDCFLHNTQIDQCSKCLSNGICIKDDNNFLCLCPQCYQGDLCEFNLQAFGFTLDSILVDYSRKVKIIYLSLMFLLFLIGLFNNLCSFVTFKRSAPRKFGVGNYLLINTCFNQISLFFLLLKLIQITFGISTMESCRISSYLFSVVTRLTYWLTSWVTIDRLFTILFPTSVTLKSPRLSIGISIATSLCLFGIHIHEIIYYTTMYHPSTGSTICVTNFDTNFISIYNRVSTLIHYLLPFFIQIIAITLLIVLAARSRNKTSGGKTTFSEVLIKQFQTQKELYITPIIIILSALPQTILTFSLACTQLEMWHRHLLLITYLLSHAPQILGFILYVWPSSTYKKEFSETSFAKRFCGWIFTEKKSTITVSKKQ